VRRLPRETRQLRCGGLSARSRGPCRATSTSGSSRPATASYYGCGRVTVVVSPVCSARDVDPAMDARSAEIRNVCFAATTVFGARCVLTVRTVDHHAGLSDVTMSWSVTAVLRVPIWYAVSG
jgi:hypothetical protein